jgi:endonuclease YncB( thermonuclease family)
MLRLIAVLLLIAPAALADINGPVRVIDGDTLEVADQRIRLHGIDAPERGQTCKASGVTWRCGERATLALFGKIGRNQVRCEVKYRDRYRRDVATCYAGGDDLGRWMVREGWAVADRLFSDGYIAVENEARAAGRNLWRGAFVMPWHWRRGKRLGDPEEAAPGEET